MQGGPTNFEATPKETHMKRLIFALALLPAPALAQAPTDAEIAQTWAICEPYKTHGRTSVATPWLAGKPVFCIDEFYAEYLKSAPAIEAKANADAEEARLAKGATSSGAC
jgi:hypothetical protein